MSTCIQFHLRSLNLFFSVFLFHQRHQYWRSMCLQRSRECLRHNRSQRSLPIAMSMSTQYLWKVKYHSNASLNSLLKLFLVAANVKNVVPDIFKSAGDPPVMQKILCAKVSTLKILKFNVLITFIFQLAIVMDTVLSASSTMKSICKENPWTFMAYTKAEVYARIVNITPKE